MDIILRSFCVEDAPLMLEWMHDKEIVRFLKADFSNKKLIDCINFINSANESKNSIHYAVAVNNEYQGTVSLKNIRDSMAEFAICMRRQSFGHGIAAEGMRKMLEYGLKTCNLKLIYWCVSPQNARAVRFYEKHHYRRIEINEMDNNLQKNVIMDYGDKIILDYIWYIIKNN